MVTRYVATDLKEEHPATQRLARSVVKPRDPIHVRIELLTAVEVLAALRLGRLGHWNPVQANCAGGLVNLDV